MSITKLGNLNNLSALAAAAKNKSKSDAPGKAVLTVPVDKVVSKVQVRKKFVKIEELAESIKNEGLQSPIIVSPANADGIYVIQKGERRWRAVKHAGLPDIEIIINEKQQTRLDEVAGELGENIQRENLTPLEIADALQEFIDAKWSQADIARRIGKGKTFVSSHLALLKIPECVKALYDAEKCSDPDTLINLGNLYNIDKSRCEAVCRIAMENGISRKESREILDDAQRIIDAKKTPAKKNPPISQPSSGEEDDNVQSEQNKNIPGDNDVDPFAEDENSDGVEEGLAGSETGVTNPKDEPPKKEKPAKQNNGGSNDAMGAVPVDPQWKVASPDALIFVVNVKGDKPQRGVIVTDRIANEPTKVCIKVMDGKKEKHLIVPIEGIELIGIEH